MILFVPVVVICSALHGVPSEEGYYCATDRPVQLAHRNLEQCLINAVGVMQRLGGQDEVSSVGCEEMTDDGADPGQSDGTPAR